MLKYARGEYLLAAGALRYEDQPDCPLRMISAGAILR